MATMEERVACIEIDVAETKRQLEAVITNHLPHLTERIDWVNKKISFVLWFVGVALTLNLAVVGVLIQHIFSNG